MVGMALSEVVKKLQAIAPLSLAESWDNVGLLIEPDSDHGVNSVLLTIDLTEDVVEEAIELGTQLIISYHPNIFKPLKCVTQSTWKERIIVQCIKNNIAVFSPHTTWDAMLDGVNDWLASCFKASSTMPLLPNSENPKLGMGRCVNLVEPIRLAQIVNDLKAHIGIQSVRVGVGRGKYLESDMSTIALCAGSGASVLAGVKTDVYITGEMLHHDILEATQRGISVILCNHSDSERGYLKNFQKCIASEQLKVFVSKFDRDPLRTV